MRQINLSIYFGTGLAFLWPLKKGNQYVAGSEEKNTSIQECDNLFDDGHYEECYKLLLHLQEAKVSKIAVRMN